MKSQMKAADRSGAAFAVIVGESERDAGTVIVRPLRGGGEQQVGAAGRRSSPSTRRSTHRR